MLKTIRVEDFQRCYQKSEQRLHRCVTAQGNYFEGDNIDVWKKMKILVNKKSVLLLFCHTLYIYWKILELLSLLSYCSRNCGFFLRSGLETWRFLPSSKRERSVGQRNSKNLVNLPAIPVSLITQHNKYLSKFIIKVTVRYWGNKTNKKKDEGQRDSGDIWEHASD